MMNMISIEEHNAAMEALKAEHADEIKEWAERCNRLLEESKALKSAIAALTVKIEELEARLNKNSRNSSKPPSSDGLRKKPITKSLRQKTGRAPGGQKGHSGATLELTEAPDRVVEIKPQETCECGGAIIITDDIVIRQETDIELPKKIVVEYRARSGVCERCGKIHKSSFPDGVKSTVSYGQGIQAVLTYLNTYQLLPLNRAAEMMRDLFDVKVSEASIINASQNASDKMFEAERRIKEEIIDSDVVGFDETGMRVNGSLYWLHSAGTEREVLYTLHKNRGKEGMEAQGILPEFKGTAVHDHWKSYYSYGCAHAECNAHHLRHLTYLFEEMKQEWAGEMLRLLMKIKRHVELSILLGVDQLPHVDINEYERVYRSILAVAANALMIDDPYGSSADVKPNAAKDFAGVAGRGKNTEAVRMIKRMAKYGQETLTFMYDFSVPFDNNAAERNIRMPKQKQKISGCFRTEEGGTAFARIRSYISTAKKKGKNILRGIQAALEGRGVTYLYPESH